MDEPNRNLKADLIQRSSRETDLATTRRVVAWLRRTVIEDITTLAAQIEALDKVLDDPQHARHMVVSLRHTCETVLDGMNAAIYDLTHPQTRAGSSPDRR